jgi:hypothetical protein
METKTKRLLSRLADGPLKWAEVGVYVGRSQATSLAKAGAIEKFTAENPNYANGEPGQKPMCLWVRLGAEPYAAHGRYREASDKGIADAIKFLERHGYKVTRL